MNVGVASRFWPSNNAGKAIIIGLSLAGGLVATLTIPRFDSWIPYDYLIYIQGARLVRLGFDPHALLPYWYPLPIVLFTTLPWSFLPYQFAWAFAFIPLGILHLRYGRRAIWWWLFFPLLINVTFAQAEGWLILPLCWLLDDMPTKSSLGIIALMFKPAYGMFLVPYRVGQWLLERRWKDLAWLVGLSGAMMGAAFLVDPGWPLHWLAAVLRRGDNEALQARNMTVWAFSSRGTMGILALGFVLVVLIWLTIPLLSVPATRGDALLALSLVFFPGGLNPVSSMMVMPLVETRGEILVMVAVSWLAAGLDTIAGGFGGAYLIIVLAALALRRRRYLISVAVTKE